MSFPPTTEEGGGGLGTMTREVIMRRSPREGLGPQPVVVVVAEPPPPVTRRGTRRAVNS
jgi:hypothetical protein